MRAAIITIGTELTEGRIADINTGFMAGELERLGLRVALALTVPDDDAAISKGLNFVLDRDVALIVIAGGLGPTQDDLTAPAVARALELETELNSEAAAMIARAVGGSADALKPHQAKQAILPAGSIPIIPAGTAPGFIVMHGEIPIICFPGVPWELEAMWEDALAKPQAAAIAGSAVAPGRRQLYLYGCGEPAVAAAVETFLGTEPGGIEISICARYREVLLEAAFPPKGTERAEELMNFLKDRLGEYIYSEGEEIIDVIASELIRRSKTIAVGESCTGGMLGAAITGLSGASGFFRGGVVAYDNDVKMAVLKVRRQTLDAVGAVSEAVAQQMAIGAREICAADYGIGITGIAGPTGGTAEKPVGLVYICVSSEAGDLVQGFNFPGGREEVRLGAVTASLHMLFSKLQNDPE